jgi:hypothetical protein
MDDQVTGLPVSELSGSGVAGRQRVPRQDEDEQQALMNESIHYRSIDQGLCHCRGAGFAPDAQRVFMWWGDGWKLASR